MPFKRMSSEHPVPARDQELLLGYLLRALDESEVQELEQRLHGDRVLQAELDRLHACILPLADDVPEAPPPGLAQRTCEFVFEETRPMVGAAASAHLGSDSPVKWTLLDTFVAAVVLTAASLIFFPALGFSRFHADVSGCQNNLRALGYSLARYAENHGGVFPVIPTEGPGATPAIYACILKENNLLENNVCVFCPAELGQREPPRVVPTAREFCALKPDELPRIQHELSSYGYHLGCARYGVHVPARNRSRASFPLLADAPRADLSGHPSNNHGPRGFNALYEQGNVRFVAASALRYARDHYFLNDERKVAPGLHPDDSVIAPAAAPPGVCMILQRD